MGFWTEGLLLDFEDFSDASLIKPLNLFCMHGKKEDNRQGNVALQAKNLVALPKTRSMPGRKWLEIRRQIYKNVQRTMVLLDY